MVVAYVYSDSSRPTVAEVRPQWGLKRPISDHAHYALKAGKLTQGSFASPADASGSYSPAQ